MEQLLKRIPGVEIIGKGKSSVLKTWGCKLNGKSFDVFLIIKEPAHISVLQSILAEARRTNTHLLFVVSYDAIPEDLMMLGQVVGTVPEWLRVLHALYFGRVYVYDQHYDKLMGLHWQDIATRPVPSIERNIPLSLQFSDHECYHPAMPGQYLTCQFKDKPWWKTGDDKVKYTQGQPYSSSPFGDDSPFISPEEILERLRKAREEAQRFYQQTHTSGNGSTNQQWHTGGSGQRNWRERPPHTQAEWQQYLYEAGGGQIPFDEHYNFHRTAPEPTRELPAHRVLGVSAGATQQEIKIAYRKLVKENHPDLHPGDKAAQERMVQINLAFEELSK